MPALKKPTMTEQQVEKIKCAAQKAIERPVKLSDSHEQQSRPVIPHILQNRIRAILKMTQFYRFAGLEQTTADGDLRIRRNNRSVGQDILGAVTVFNFYDAGFAPSTGPIGDFVAEFEANTGTEMTLTAPEAQILGPNVIGEFAQFHSFITSDLMTENPSISGEPSSTVLNDINDSPFKFNAGLIRYLDVMLCHGQLPSSVASQLRNSMNTQGGASPEALTDLLSVIFSSPAYSVAN